MRDLDVKILTETTARLLVEANYRIPLTFSPGYAERQPRKSRSSDGRRSNIWSTTTRSQRPSSCRSVRTAASPLCCSKSARMCTGPAATCRRRSSKESRKGPSRAICAGPWSATRWRAAIRVAHPPASSTMTSSRAMACGSPSRRRGSAPRTWARCACSRPPTAPPPSNSSSSTRLTAPARTRARRWSWASASAARSRWPRSSRKKRSCVRSTPVIHDPTPPRSSRNCSTERFVKYLPCLFRAGAKGIIGKGELHGVPKTGD